MVVITFPSSYQRVVQAVCNGCRMTRWTKRLVYIAVKKNRTSRQPRRTVTKAVVSNAFPPSQPRCRLAAPSCVLRLLRQTVSHESCLLYRPRDLGRSTCHPTHVFAYWLNNMFFVLHLTMKRIFGRRVRIGLRKKIVTNTVGISHPLYWDNDGGAAVHNFTGDVARAFPYIAGTSPRATFLSSNSTHPSVYLLPEFPPAFFLARHLAWSSSTR